MRVLSVSLLLPLLLTSASCNQTVPSAKANDDRPASPQPAIAPSAVPEKLTIESLAGTYKPDDEVRWQAERLEEMKRDGLDDAALKSMKIMLEDLTTSKVIINGDGTFEFQEFDFKAHGQVKRDDGKFSLSINFPNPPKGADSSTKVSKCTQCCAFKLFASADGRTLLRYDSRNSSKLLRVYVKQ